MNTIEPVLLKELNETDYESLISYRIRKILMICSNYDAFILEEDGQIESQIFKEYIDLNLSNPPKFIWVQTASEARELLNTVVGIDMVMCMYNVSDKEVFSLASCDSALELILSKYLKYLWSTFSVNTSIM